MLTSQDLRSLFLLRDDIHFLNHGSFGACPRPVFEQYQDWQRELERQPVEFLGRRFNDLLREARTALAQYLHAAPDEVVYVPNATVGLNIVARSLPLGPGDEVLSTDHEYGALDRTWRFLCLKQGAEYVRVPLPLPFHSAEEIVARLWARVTPRTRVLFISHLTSPTAIILPVAELVRRAQERCILTVIDGAHAPGQIPLDLEALGADFYSGNCHKWMLAPKGSAFLYARRAMQPRVEPLVVSWGWESEKPSPSRFVDEQEWQGTREIAAYLSVPAAIEFMRERRWDAVRYECHALLRYAREEITRVTGLEPPTPDSPDWFAQMVSLPLPPCDADEVKRRLYDEYRVEVPIINWNGGQLIRVSIQGYNNREDVDALAQALAHILQAPDSLLL